MSAVESSIIIPVFNQWNLTRACLKALAATIKDRDVEVIIVDNGSTDVTPQACPVLGRTLFGEAFRYHRSATNLNFGPASNLGARMAAGEFLIFLNNDTEPLPGWYQPLLDDFAAWPDIAATGPLLLYPKSEPFGYTVQHLGVRISPFMSVGHLYEGIPAESPLAQKRRFFQVITAACMVMRRSVFMEVGLFDEHYINGFEDVDLCARLSHQGYRMTVNPEARVIHHTSQTPGRHSHEEENSAYLMEHGLQLLVPDWHQHVKDDGLRPHIGPWQTLQIFLPPDQRARLDRVADKAPAAVLKDLLLHNPFWEKGWSALTQKEENASIRAALEFTWFKLYPSPEGAMRLCASARAAHDAQAAVKALHLGISFCKPFDQYLKKAEEMRAWCAHLGLAPLAEQYAAWLAGAESFRTERYLPCLAALRRMAAEMDIPLMPHEDWTYTLWRELADLPGRAAAAPQSVEAGEPPVRFSVLMPVYNPKAEHFVAALESVLAQDYPHWELCVADDASTDPHVAAILVDYAAGDGRIRYTRREKNGHIAAATNTALEMARHPWTVLLDQDDLLTPDALRQVAAAIQDYPDGLLFFSDEDKIREDGSLFYPYLKNDKWDWELLCGQNFVNHLGVYRTDKIRQLGGFREGVRGSQDYDLLLRYVAGADAARLIHIPHVLYHWRAHAGSTATDVGVKSEAVESARRALQDYLDAAGSAAVVEVLEGSQFLRVRHPLPHKRPLVSLICHMGEDLAPLQAQLAALQENTAYGKYEILVVCSEAVPQRQLVKARRLTEGQKNIHLVLHPKNFSQAQCLQWGAQKAQGQVLGFLSGGVAPVTPGWLEELVACLCRAGVGAVGGKLLRRNETSLHCGYLTDASGTLAPVLSGMPRHTPGWFNWNMMARTVDALDGLCLFTRAETLAGAGGFDAAVPDAAVPDYCLRLDGQGLRTVWWPFAAFVLLDDKKARRCDDWVDTAAFAARWKGRLTPFSRDLAATRQGWALQTDAVGSEAAGGILRLEAEGVPKDFSPEEYLLLYPDVRASGMDPLIHYLQCGRQEGRKPCCSHIDYSGLTPERLARFRAAPPGDVVVCTSVAGNYERLLPPAYLNDGWRYVCYTDTPMESYGIWEMRPIPYANADPTRRARWAKLHLPELFPDARWVLWMDANIAIAGDFSSLLTMHDGTLPLYTIPHPVRDCIYDEAVACIATQKDEPKIICSQVAFYRAQGMPEHFGLYETNLMLVNPVHELARSLFALWWAELESYSKRDQISLPYTLFQLNIPVVSLLPGNGTPRCNDLFYFLTHEETMLTVAPMGGGGEISGNVV